MLQHSELEKTKLQLGITSGEFDDLLTLYLEDSEIFYLDLEYGTRVPDVFERTPSFLKWIRSATIEQFNKRGEEGIKSVSTLGTSYSYTSADISWELKRQVTQRAVT